MTETGTVRPPGTQREAEASFFLLVGSALLALAGFVLLLGALYLLYSLGREGLLAARLGTALSASAVGLGVPALGAGLFLAALRAVPWSPRQVALAWGLATAAAFILIGLLSLLRPAPPRPLREEARAEDRRNESLALFEQAEAGLREGRLDDAARQVKSALQLSFFFPEAWVLLGQVELKRSDHGRAAQAFARSLEQLDKPPELVVYSPRADSSLAGRAYLGWAAALLEEARSLEAPGSLRQPAATEELLRAAAFVERARRVSPDLAGRAASLEESVGAVMARTGRKAVGKGETGLPAMPGRSLSGSDALEWFRYGLDFQGRDAKAALQAFEVAARAGAYGNARFRLAQAYLDEGLWSEALRELEAGFTELPEKGYYPHPSLSGTPEGESGLGRRLWARAALAAARSHAARGAGSEARGWIGQGLAQCRELERLEPGAEGREESCSAAREWGKAPARPGAK